MAYKLYILNPNSSAATTSAMQRGAANVLEKLDVDVVFDELQDGPPGIETQAHVEAAAFPVLSRFQSVEADAYVIGCFSDPGLALCRSELSRPVFGIAEAAYLEASTLGSKFGVISIVGASIPRHLRQIRILGLQGSLAGDRSLDLGVKGLEDPEIALPRIIEIGKQLRDVDGASVLVLGCASMGVYRPRIEAALGIPVVDPVQAAIVRAHNALILNYPKATQ